MQKSRGSMSQKKHRKTGGNFGAKGSYTNKRVVLEANRILSDLGRKKPQTEWQSNIKELFNATNY